MTVTRSTGAQIAVMNYHPKGHLGREEGEGAAGVGRSGATRQ